MPSQNPLQSHRLANVNVIAGVIATDLRDPMLRLAIIHPLIRLL